MPEKNEDHLLKAKQVFNEKTITEMSYKEIIAANKESRKGTFMDRSWKENQKNVLLDNDMTRW